MKRNVFSIFRYRGKDRYIDKANKNLLGLVDDHHIIPKSLKKHKLIRSINYDINSNFNLFIMPNKKGKNILNLNPDIRIHRSHYCYNLFVKDSICEIYRNNKSLDEREYNMWLFVTYLRDNLKYYTEKIPW